MPDDAALLCLAAWLQQQGYRFITVTPATHARINARANEAEAKSLEDVFGWSKPFRRSLLPPSALAWLERGQAVEYGAGTLRSKIRFATLGGSLYMHSAYPTTQADAVFFGPDTYRFTALIQRTLSTARHGHVGCVVDLGCGAGAGGIVAMQALGTRASKLVFSDINPLALRYAGINAALARTPHARFLRGDLYDPVDQPIDLLVSNPPYLLDANARVYRHGGGELGSGLSTRIVVEGLRRVAGGGMLILYTGTPIVDGTDTFWKSVAPALHAANVSYDYQELDPDVFGEELENPAYARVERIAAVALVIRMAPPIAEGRRAGAAPAVTPVSDHAV